MAVSLVLLVACNKPEQPSDDGMVDDETSNGDGDGDTGDGDGDTGDGDGDMTTTTSFVPELEMGTVADCDPIAQDCPDGDKCVAYASAGGTWDANKCVAVTGSGAVGDECVYDGAALGTDNCDATTVCWNAIDVEGQLVGTCFPFCTGSLDNPTCTSPDTSCRVVNDGTIAVCLPNCDPLLQECEQGLGCYWSGTSGTFQCIIVAGGIPTGDPCGFNNDCNPGHFCADAAVLQGCNGSACCATFCDLAEDPSSCGTGYSCVPFFEEGTAPPMYESLGVCILPP